MLLYEDDTVFTRVDQDSGKSTEEYNFNDTKSLFYFYFMGGEMETA